MPCPRARLLFSLAATVTLCAAILPARPAHAQCNTAPSMTAATPGECSVTLTWTQVTGALTYEIWRYFDADATQGEVYLATVAASSLSYTDTFAPGGSARSYRVRYGQAAFPCSGVGPFSGTITAIANRPTVPAPVSVAAGSPSCGTLTATWPAVSGIASYEVRTIDTVRGVVINTNIVQTNSYSTTLDLSNLGSLSLGFTHKSVAFSVAALKNCPGGGINTASSFTQSQAILVSRVPPALSGLTVATRACGQLEASWQWASPNVWADYVFLERRDVMSGSSFGTNIAVTGEGSSGTYLDNAVTLGRTYQYFATPWSNSCGFGPTFGPVNATTLNPAELSAAAVRSAAGSLVLLTVPAAAVAGGASPQYRWMLGGSNSAAADGVNLSNGGRISGVFTNTLRITDSRPSDSEIYKCVITYPGSTCQNVYLTGLIVPAGCPADFDQNRTLSIDDLFLFLNAWFTGCP